MYSIKPPLPADVEPGDIFIDSSAPEIYIRAAPNEQNDDGEHPIVILACGQYFGINWCTESTPTTIVIVRTTHECNELVESSLVGPLGALGSPYLTASQLT